MSSPGWMTFSRPTSCPGVTKKSASGICRWFVITVASKASRPVETLLACTKAQISLSKIEFSSLGPVNAKQVSPPFLRQLWCLLRK